MTEEEQDKRISEMLDRWIPELHKDIMEQAAINNECWKQLEKLKPGEKITFAELHHRVCESLVEKGILKRIE